MDIPDEPQPGDPIRAEVIAWLIRQVKRLSKFSATAPLELTNTGAGMAISLKRTQQYCIPVRCTQTGGVAGNQTTMCSFTYTVKRLDNSTTIATGVAVADNGNRKTIGAYTAGTYGIAFREPDGTWKLLYVSEKPAGAACA
jgi:hypothetical protein